MDEKLSKILFHNKNIIYDNLNYVINFNEQLDKTYPLHIDLHPHNILITKDEAIIIDLDSIYNISLNTSLGFGYYKLLRQDIANKSHEEKSKKLMCEIFNNTKYDNIFEPLISYYFVKKEIMRRLLLILQENLTLGSSDWNHVLNIQINALSEVDYIFQKN